MISVARARLTAPAVPALLVMLALALCVALPASATGAAPLGETFVTNNTCAGTTTVQTGSPTGNYTVPSAGVITSWQFLAGATPPTQLRLKLVQATGGNNFKVVAESAIEAPAANQLNSFPSRITAEPGDMLGFFFTPSSGTCSTVPAGSGYSIAYYGIQGVDLALGTTNSLIPQDNVRLDISALLEPDIDADGFGDETQDQCPTDASTQGPCPTAEPPADTKLEGSASAKGTQIKTGVAIRVRVKITAQEALTAEASGRIKVNRTYKLKPETMQVAGATSKTMQLVPKKKHGKKIAKALKKGKKAKAKLTLKLTDEAGNTETEKLSVKLKR